MIGSFKKPIYVTSPLLPDVKDLYAKISEIWDSKWLTNHGEKHNELERELCGTLKVPHVSLFNNATSGLLVALRALNIREGEVITTPFTFPATPHSISWNGLSPVFCDIEEETMTIDADKIESMVTKKTRAILGVHVYGFPCDVKKIRKIADIHDLRIIYDAAHTFSTDIDGNGIGNFGDISCFSFHATKLFNTFEGGCLTYRDSKLREKIYLLRNFGIKNEEEVVDIGINGKMNEVQASMGLLVLKMIKNEKNKRAKVVKAYIDNLQGVSGIVIPKVPKNTTNSYQYFPIRIIKNMFGIDRNAVYEKLKKYNVFSRKYFYPLCSDYTPYKKLPSSSKENLPVANMIKDEVLCLPLYGDLGEENAAIICKIILETAKYRK